MNRLRHLLKHAAGRPPVGTWIMSASPLVAEALGCAGFEWGVIDMEHAPNDLSQLVQQLQAVSATPLLPIVRVPWNDTVMIKRVLDAGADTLLVPFVQNAQEAQDAVAAVRYPPLGRRGMAGMSRASRFGTVADHFKVANDRVGVIVQLETPESVARLEAIAAVDGVSALFIGPGDLSGTMGYPGQLMHPEVLSLTAQAVKRARQAGKPIGTVGGTVEAVRQYREMGFDFVAIASDLGLLVRSAQAALQSLATETVAVAAAPTAHGGY